MAHIEQSFTVMLKVFGGVLTVLMVALLLQSLSAHAQVSSSLCTSSMLRSFTPCLNYLTQSSSSSGISPTADCCASLRSLISNGLACLCQIIMGGVPFRIPFNQNLAISLPRACDQAGVPIDCKASPGAPLPAPGPTAFSPFTSSEKADSPSPSGMDPVDVTPAWAPLSDTTSNINPSTTEGSVPPASSTAGTSSIGTPSAAVPSVTLAPSLLLSLIAVIIVEY
ncbi:hypothetical protein Cgig2_025767 [Carnegiea gigantea]|uniref:Bifunctional inhibitor/plant lipid transfer protein/seed storage helical domain-containing protein n=1 Tax=Carnegiea gigantea TaxID=171969 RepID=A0A9Q1JKL8_9CARY|nr:hypothetical protein Cgig2_025767 [Carnegiea gigantea]